MLKFFYMLLLVCNTTTGQCKVETFYPVDREISHSSCMQRLEEELSQAFHYKDTTVIGTCVRSDNKERNI